MGNSCYMFIHIAFVKISSIIKVIMDVTIQEVAESMFHKWSELSPNIQRKLRSSFCINCEGKLSGEVNYLLAKKIIWWHQVCPHFNNE